MVKISIVMPVYNLERYIERTLKNILAQTYQNIEVLVVDDGSKDNSWREIVRMAEYDKRIIPIHQENAGVTSARLNGVAHSTGEWIGFVDGDDEIESYMYEYLLKNAVKYHADISHCGYQMIFNDGRIHYFYNTGCLIQQDRMQGLQDLLIGSSVEPGLWSKLFHKTLFHSLLRDNVMDTSIKYNEDLLMNYYLFKESRLSVFEDFCPYHYIVRNGSATQQKLNVNRIFDPIKVKKIILNDVSSELLEIARKAYIRTCINVYNELVCYNGKKHDSDKRVVRNMIFESRAWFRCLDKRTRLSAELICWSTILYHCVYRIYVKNLQKSRYH